jgi:hypothetical protein
MTDTDTIRRHIEMVDGVGGPNAMIAGHRVRVEDVVIGHERLGLRIHRDGGAARVRPRRVLRAVPTLRFRYAPTRYPRGGFPLDNEG